MKLTHIVAISAHFTSNDENNTEKTLDAYI